MRPNLCLGLTNYIVVYCVALRLLKKTEGVWEIETLDNVVLWINFLFLRIAFSLVSLCSGPPGPGANHSKLTLSQQLT